MSIRISPATPNLLTGVAAHARLRHPISPPQEVEVGSNVARVEEFCGGRIKKVVLNNGLRIILEEIPGANSCTLNVWIGGGSVDEEERNNGVAHFIEHLLFSGTRTKSALDIAKIMDEIGADIADVNAFTEAEYRCYYATLLSEDLGVAIELFLDMLFNPRLDDDDIDIARQIITEEIKQGDDSISAETMLYKYALVGHPLSRPTIGTIDSISTLRKSDVESHLRKFFTPANMVISVAGKFKLDEVIMQISDLTLAVDSRTVEKELPPQLVVKGGVVIKNRPTEQAHLMLATSGVSALEEDRYVLAVLNAALGTGWSSRLVQEVREKRGLAYNISSCHQNFAFGGLFYIHVGTRSQEVSQVLDLILKELTDIRTNGLKAEELENAKKRLKRGLLLRSNSQSDIAAKNALSELYYNKVLTMEEVLNSVESVTNERIIRLASKIFNPQCFAIVVVGPREELPSKCNLQGILDNFT